MWQTGPGCEEPRADSLPSTQAHTFPFTAFRTKTEPCVICPYGLIHPDILGLLHPHPTAGNIAPTPNAAARGCLHPLLPQSGLPLALPTHLLQAPGAPQRLDPPFVPERQPVSPLLAAKSILTFPCLNETKLRLLHCGRKASWLREEDIPFPALLPTSPFITSTSRPFTTSTQQGKPQVWMPTTNFLVR